MIRDIAQTTLIQSLLDKNVLGKYLASKATINQAVFSLSVFLTGLIVDLVSARFVYFFSGVLLLCSAIYGCLKLRNTAKNLDQV